MPHYSFRKTFTAGKTVTTQEELEMPCFWGVLDNVTISFPAGCHGLCHVHIDETLHQVFPTNPEANYALDDFTLPIMNEYKLEPGVRKLYLRGWNEDIWPHTINVTFTIRPPGRLTPTERAMLRVIKILEKMLGLR